MVKNFFAWFTLGTGVLATVVSGTMRFQAVETRVNALEVTAVSANQKLDSISATLARIEGRLEAEREQKRGR